MARPIIRPAGMSEKEFHRKSSQARQRATSRLQIDYAVEYHRMIDEERIKLGLPPSSHTKTVVKEATKAVVPSMNHQRYFIFAENSNVARTWAKEVKLESRYMYYLGSVSSLRNIKINLATDRIVFIAGWRSKKSLETQKQMEQLLEMATMHQWHEILASKSVLFIER